MYDDITLKCVCVCVCPFKLRTSVYLYTNGHVISGMNLTLRASKLASKGSWLNGIGGEVNWRQMLGASLSHLFLC